MMMSNSCDIGLVGLAVMGENLALNVESRGYRVAVFNRTAAVVDKFISTRGQGKNFAASHSIHQLVANLAPPRKAMLMVKAGPAVDDVIELQRGAAICARLTALPIHYRLPLLLHYGGEYSIREIAEKLQLEEKTVRKRIARARRLLRQRVPRDLLALMPFLPDVSGSATPLEAVRLTGATVGLSSNGCTPGRPEALRVRPRRSPDQLVHVLESLAFISAFTLSRFQDFLITEQRNVPAGATLLIVSPMYSDKIAEAIHRLHAMGKRMAFICVDHAAPDFGELPCPVFHIPPNPEYAAFMRRFVSPEEETA